MFQREAVRAGVSEAPLTFFLLRGFVLWKFENHCHMIALYAVWYNFIRIHKTLRCTPAMQAGVTDKLFAFDDLIGIVDEWEANQKNTEL